MIKYFCLSAWLVVAAAGCSSSTESTGDDLAHVQYPAPHPAAPRVVSLGGRVLKSPRIVPITWDGDPWRDSIEQFVATIGTTEYWKSIAGEYGVGPATSANPIHIHASAPGLVTYPQFVAWLQQKLEGNDLEWPLPDGNTIYAIYYPAGTSYGSGACLDGDDWFITLSDGTRVPYVVMPRCPPWPGMDAWDSFTWTQSHEFLEEATDPYKTAFYTDGADDMAWSWAPPLAEIGDMCDYPWELTSVNGLGRVQRAWSNAAAAAGKDPCVPGPAGAYFNAAPVLNDAVYLYDSSGARTTTGVHIPVGQTRTIEVDLFSDAPTYAWQVDAVDFNHEIYGAAPDLQLWLNRTTGVNGDKLSLTIHALKAGSIGGSRFIMTSKLGTRMSHWIGYVGN